MKENTQSPNQRAWNSERYESVIISTDYATESEIYVEYNDSHKSESLEERGQSHRCILWVPCEDGEVHLGGKY